MSDAEYILRLIIRARDEFAAVFAKARTEIAGLRHEVNSAAGDFDKMNARITSLSLRLNTVTKRINEARSGLRELAQGSSADFDKLSKDVDKVTDSVTRSSKAARVAAGAQHDATQEFDRMTDAAHRLTREFESGQRSRDSFLKDMNRLSSEAQSMAKKFDLGSAISDVFTEISIEAKRSADEVVASEKRQTDAAKQRAKETEALQRKIKADAEAAARDRARIDAQSERERAAASAREQRDQDQRVRRQLAANETALRRSNAAAAKEISDERARNDAITNTLRNFDRYNKSIGQRTSLTAQESSVLRRYVTDLARLRGQVSNESPAFHNLSRAISDAEGRFKSATTEIRRLRNDADMTGRSVNRLAGFFGSISRTVQGTGENVAKMDNQLRGLIVLAVLAFAQQLISVLTALGGELVAVAASAAQAASALGGMAVAGAAQALPVIGLLAAAFHRLSIIQNALQKSDMVRMQTQQRSDKQNLQGKQNTDRLANANDSLRTALENVAQAHDRVHDARTKLNDAIREGRLELEDLISAEKQQELAARGAALSQSEARDQLRQAIASGTTGTAFQRAELNVADANLGASDAGTALKRARQDETKVGGNVMNLDSVKQAQKALADAQRGALDAERAVNRAKRGIDQAGIAADKATQGYFAADSQLQYMLSQMSAAERRLFKSVQNIQDVYRKNFRPVTDIIINSFTRGVDEGAKLLKRKDILDAAKGLATSIAHSLDRVRVAFTQPDMLRQFLRIVAQAKANLAPLTTIAINVGKALANIAEAAGPSLHRFIGFVSDLVKRFLDLTGHKKKLEDFFGVAEQQLESWIKLGLAVLHLFMAISGAGGAAEGKKSVDDLTKSIDGMADRVEKNGSRVRKFFQDARRGTDAVLSVFRTLAREIGKSFSPGSVEGFAKFLNIVVIPALGEAVRFTGSFMHALTGLLSMPLVGGIAKWAFSFLLFTKTVTGMYGLVGMLAAQTEHFLTIMGGGPASIAKFTTGIAGMGTKMTEAGKLASSFEKVTLMGIPMSGARAGAAMGKLGGVITRFGMLARGAAAFAFGPWGLAIAGVIAAIILLDRKFHFLEPTFKWLKGAFGDVINWLKTHWPLVLTILTGPFGLAVTLIVKHWKAITHAITGGFDGIRHGISSAVNWIVDKVQWVGKQVERLLPSPFRNAGHSAADGLLSGFKSIGGFFAGIGKWLFNHVIKPIYDFFEIKSPSGLFKRIGGNLVDGLKDGLDKGIHSIGDFLEGLGKRIIGALVRGIKNDANALKDAIGWLLDKVPGGGLVKKGLSAVGGVFRNTGGPIPGYGDSDSVQAWLTPGEHVWTKDEVRAAGGHGIMFALRSFFGGGTQSTGNRFAYGGGVARSAMATATINVDADNDRTAHNWRLMWQEMVNSTRRNAATIESRMRDMRVNLTNTLEKLHTDFTEQIVGIEMSGKVHVTRLGDSWRKTFDDISNVVYDGLFYIGHETNRALTGLGSQHIDFGLARPQATRHATGGVVGGPGSWGQRGKDTILAWLGRGETVLNRDHQRYIAPAVEAYYGHPFSKTFDRIRGFHAGGPEQLGYATGRGGDAALFDGHPSNVVSGLITLLRQLKRRFPQTVVTSTRDHGYLTTNGNVSDHVSGHAMDISGSESLMSRIVGWIKSSGVARKLKQGIHNPGLSINQGHTVPDSFWGPATWAQHANHIHLALAGALGSIMDATIRRLHVTGPQGALQGIGQAIMDRARRAANRKIDAESMMGMDDHAGAAQVAPPGQLRNWISKALRLTGHFSPDNVNSLFARVMFESSGNVKAINLTDSNAAKGTPSKGLAQVIDPTFQSYRLKSLPNDIYNPIANLVAAIRYMIARYGTIVGNTGVGYAAGGELPGPDGAPLNILAHAGEWILNKVQQSKLAKLIGVSPDAIKSMIGLPHGKRTAATGTVVGGATGVEDATTAPLYTSADERKRLAAIKKGIYELRILPLKNWEDFLTEARRVFNALGNAGMEWKKRVADINKEIGKLKKGGVTKDEAAQIGDLRTERTRLQRNVPGARTTAGVDRRIKALDALTSEGGLFDQMDTAREKMAASLARQLSSLTYKFNTFGKGAGRNWNVIANTDKVDLANKALSNARQQFSSIRDEENDITKALGQVQARMTQIRKGGVSKKEAAEYGALSAELTNLQGRYAKIRDEHFAALQAVWEAQVAAQQAQVDAINAQYTKYTEDTQRSIAHEQARGGDTGGLNQRLRDQNEAYANALEKQIAGAQAIGNQDLVDSLTKQVADLRESIFESLQQDVQSAFDAITNAQANRTRITDLRNRGADVRDKLGDAVGAAAARVDVGRQQGLDLGTTLADQQRLLASQMALPENQRNLTVIKALNESIDDLKVQVDENSAAQKDLVTALHQTQIDIISGRQSFQGGVLGSLGQLLQTIGTNRGDQSTVAQQLGLLGQQGTLLGQTGGGLRSQLLKNFGINIDPSLHGEQFASAVSSLNFDQIETNMSAADKAQFESLIQSIIDNEQATVENTKSIDDLNGTVAQPQQFSTSAWQWFRSAVFNGMGGVLPQYTVPSAYGGPYVANANSTANVTADSGPGATNKTVNQDISVNYHEVNEAPSALETANRVAWEAKTANTME